MNKSLTNNHLLRADENTFGRYRAAESEFMITNVWFAPDQLLRELSASLEVKVMHYFQKLVTVTVTL